jgi:hypothetical protein
MGKYKVRNQEYVPRNSIAKNKDNSASQYSSGQNYGCYIFQPSKDDVHFNVHKFKQNFIVPCKK